MSDIPGDALAAIEWLLDPLATDRRKEVYWRSVMLKAMIEIQQGRAEVERLYAALSNFGNHHPGCSAHEQTDCDCGYRQALMKEESP